MVKRHRILAFLVLALFLRTPHADAQRPKIAVVLEGGGALGLAHIGVLEYLEANHIPVDFIAGTSMGGLVGGLYASGKSTTEIRQLIQSIDWNATLGGVIPFQDLSFRRKEDQLAYPNRLVFGVRNGLSIPDGINSGHQLGLILDRATLGYSNVRSFDDLPVPFRCVAVEMTKGEEVVFEKGDLGVALRSTMSIPGVFSPSREGDKVYTDGGTLNNLPVDIAKRMGADIVIAVLLQTAPMKPNELNSIGGVIARTVSIVISAAEMKNIKAADILIGVDVAKFTVWDYAKASEIADLGAEAAATKKGILSKFAVPEAEFQAMLAARKARVPQIDSVKPAFFDVTGASRPELKESIEESLQPFLNKQLERDAFEAALTKIVGIGRFENVGYRLERRDGQDGIRVRAREKAYGPPFLNLGINIDGVDIDDVRFDVAARLTFVDFGGYRREWRTDLQFGGRYGINSEYYAPLTPTSKWFVAPRASIGTEPFRIYDGDTQVAIYGLTQTVLGGDLGYAISQVAEARAGYEVRWFNASRRIGAGVLPNVDDRAGIVRLRLRHEGLDDPVVARKGKRAYFNFDYYSHLRSGIDPYPVLRTGAEYYRPVTRRGSWFVGAEAGTVFGASDVLFPPFLLGGPRNFGAYGQNEIYATKMIYGTLGWTHEIFKLSPLLGDRVFAVGFYQLGTAKTFTEDRNPQSATGLIVVKTLFGPIFVGGSLGDAAHRRWYFGMGRAF